MKTTKLFLTIILLFALKTTMAQETWYEHWVMDFGNPPVRPNINSISTNKSYLGITCGDSGYIANWITAFEDYWVPNSDLITNINLYSTIDVDSFTETKAFIVGEDGVIMKTDFIPQVGNIPFYFQSSPTTQDLFSVFFSNYLSGIAVGNAGTVIRTTDGGEHWEIISNITSNRLYSVQFPSDNIGYAVGVNGTVIKTTNGGGNWVIKTQAFADTLRCVWFTDDNTGFVVSRNGAIFKTTDGGNNWQSKPSGITQNINAIRFTSASLGYAAGNENKLLRTDDAGETWTLQILPTIYYQGHYQGIGISTIGQVSLIGSNGTALGNYPENVSIQEYRNNENVVITPNPAKDKITISRQNNEKNSSLDLSIYNLQGQLLLQQTLKQSSSQIDISILQQGIYIAKVSFRDGSYSQKKFVVVE